MRRFMPMVAVLLGACGSDGITGSTLRITDLAGSWYVTRAEVINAADSTQRRDAFPSGTIATLTVAPAGDFTLWVMLPDSTRFIELGRLAVSGDTLTYDGAGDELLFRIVLRGNTMTWRALETELYDVNHDGIPEETYEVLAFARTE